MIKSLINNIVLDLDFSRGSLVDHSGNGNNIDEVFGKPRWAMSSDNIKGVRFRSRGDNENNFVIAEDVSLNLASEISIVAFGDFGEIHSPNPTFGRYISTKRVESPAINIQHGLILLSDKVGYFSGAVGVTIQHSSTYRTAKKQSKVIAITHAHNGKVDFYDDGVFISQGADDYPIAGGDGKTYIGGLASLSVLAEDLTLDDVLHRVIIFDKKLTASEILGVYNDLVFGVNQGKKQSNAFETGVTNLGYHNDFSDTNANIISGSDFTASIPHNLGDFKIVSGTWKIDEDSVGKFMACTGTGTVFAPCPKADTMTTDIFEIEGTPVLTKTKNGLSISAVVGEKIREIKLTK